MIAGLDWRTWERVRVLVAAVMQSKVPYADGVTLRTLLRRKIGSGYVSCGRRESPWRRSLSLTGRYRLLAFGNDLPEVAVFVDPSLAESGFDAVRDSTFLADASSTSTV
jgi:hypothetical protein